MNVICEAVEMRPRDLFMGLRGSIGGIPWGHQAGLMSLQMIHEAYKPVYM